ncbi:uncharacterized protein DEA37_0001357 [Paragonimus westermani]|uniref:BPTI/Kunitz inhibitor domain-containing protein n=1 Tax=Paragonimus westermani TaxID=34504 RepID=A0A5J4NI04_9TREM|nr:uncharacterized protein DEA37_0001357 [Paragonimus westermani]
MGIFRPTAMVIAALVCTLIVQQSSALQQRCLLLPERGPCMGHFMRYAYDARSGQCVKFVYGGFQGNVYKILCKLSASCMRIPFQESALIQTEWCHIYFNASSFISRYWDGTIASSVEWKNWLRTLRVTIWTP